MRFDRALMLLLCGALTLGCARADEDVLVVTGFLADYARLAPEGSDRMRFVAADAGKYSKFLIEPVQYRAPAEALTPEQAREVAAYFDESLLDQLTSRGYSIVTEPGPGVGRVRIALTDVHRSRWWLEAHPNATLGSVGPGGATMEGEVVDSLTGEQIAAVVQAGQGRQFDLDAFSRLDDVKDTIDMWTQTMGDRLDELTGRGQR